MAEKKNIPFWLSIKDFYVHGDFNLPNEFDISEIKGYSGERSLPQKIVLPKNKQKPIKDSTQPINEGKTYQNEASNKAWEIRYKIGYADDRIYAALERIHMFEKNLDESLEVLNKEFETKKYKYNGRATKKYTR